MDKAELKKAYIRGYRAGIRAAKKQAQKAIDERRKMIATNEAARRKEMLKHYEDKYNGLRDDY